MQRLGLTEAFAIDLGEAANLDYYTGLTFRIYVPEWGTEIGSGGRYDRLIGNFGAAEPAVGFSLSLDGLAGALANQNHDQPWQSVELPESVDYQGQLAETFSRARELRNQNKKVKIGADQ